MTGGKQNGPDLTGEKPPRRGVAAGRGRLSLLLPALLLAFLFLEPALRAAEPVVSKEYRIKAAFLYNFTKFVEWPPSRFTPANTPIVIGILGHNPFADELEKIVQGRQVNGRLIVIKTIEAEADFTGVHLLFVPASEEPRTDFAALLAKHPTAVTVGESPRFAAAGGMIVFQTEDDKVKFSINLAAAENADLKFSAQLLKLASSVRRKL